LEVTGAKKNVRVLVCGELPAMDARAPQLDEKRVNGGLLVQDQDVDMITKDELKVVTKRAPTEKEIDD
ncbi:bifunctional phosphoribosylaminoimidazolecarboxamide formyltransferase/IMP cyclohydrolase, partial [Acinetobacter baumannii]